MPRSLIDRARGVVRRGSRVADLPRKPRNEQPTRRQWEVDAGLWLFDGRRETAIGIPHEAKAFYLLRAIRAIEATTLVETGTYLGDMVARLRPYVEEVHTIELSPELYRRAVERFRSERNVHVYQGDSAIFLPRILERLRRPAVIFLDGHYSEGETARGSVVTPIWDELNAVAASSHRHAVVIDDARGFGVWQDYPATEEIAAWARNTLNDYATFVDTDEICVLPREIETCMR